MIVLDTHTLVWWVAGQSELSGVAKMYIDNALKNNDVIVSSISAWEIAMLVSHGRLALAMDVE